MKTRQTRTTSRTKKYTGHWWLASAPDQTVTGTLSINRYAGVSLQVAAPAVKRGTESLAVLVQPSWTEAIDSPRLVVHGQERGGRFFTLYDGFVSNSGMGAAPITVGSMYFNHALEGVCVDDPWVLPVHRVYARYPGMDAWLAFRPFEVKHEGSTRVSISYRRPDRVVVPIDDRKSLVIAFSSKGPNQSDVQTLIRMQFLPWLGVEYAEPVAPDEAFNDVTVIGEMLGMFLGAPTTAHRIALYSPEHAIGFDDRSVPTEITALGARFRLPEDLNRWSTFDPLLPYSAIKDRLTSLLPMWFTLREQCWSAIVPYLASQRSPSPLAEQRFFDFASAAESLHRHCRPDDRRFPDKDAADIRDAVLPHVVYEHRESVRSMLQFINQLSYRDRLERLLQRQPSLMLDVVGDAKEQQAFCSLVRDLRNAEAHGLRRTSRTGVDGSRLVRIAAKLKVIMDTWILCEMGLDPAEIEARMRKNRRYWFYANEASWSWKNTHA